jgi:hypothetical protein
MPSDDAKAALQALAPVEGMIAAVRGALGAPAALMNDTTWRGAAADAWKGDWGGRRKVVEAFLNDAEAEGSSSLRLLEMSPITKPTSNTWLPSGTVLIRRWQPNWPAFFMCKTPHTASRSNRSVGEVRKSLPISPPAWRPLAGMDCFRPRLRLLWRIHRATTCGRRPCCSSTAPRVKVRTTASFSKRWGKRRWIGVALTSRCREANSTRMGLDAFLMPPRGLVPVARAAPNNGLEQDSAARG